MREPSRRIVPGSIGYGLASKLIALNMIVAVVPCGLLQAEPPQNQVVATVTVGNAPYALAVTPRSDAVYVANTGSNNVTVIGTPLNTVIATIPVGQDPGVLAITSDNKKVFVFNGGDKTISVISRETNTVVKTLTVPEGIYDLATSPDAKQLYITEPGPKRYSGKIQIIDTANFATLKEIKTSGFLAGSLVFTTDGKSAYGLGYHSTGDFLFRIDTASQTIAQTDIGLGVIRSPLRLGISPDNATLYVLENREFVDALAASDGTLIKQIPIVPPGVPGINKHLYGMVVTPNGEWLYISDALENTVTMVKTALERRSRAKSAIVTIQGPEAMAVSPKGNYLYVAYAGEPVGTVSVIDITR